MAKPPATNNNKKGNGVPMASASVASGSSHHIVIVGGGAGGLELATRLGDTLGKHGKAIITLADRSPTHQWQPAAWISMSTNSSTWHRRAGTTSGFAWG